MPQTCEYLILGAGIAGASIAYHLAPHGNVIMCEMESQPGYHTTGRSAAFFAETYGGPEIRPLTMHSKSFLTNPPKDFCDGSLIHERGAIHAFEEKDRARAQVICTEMQQFLKSVHIIDRERVIQLSPILASSEIVGAIFDPDCGDLDVSALHQGYLRGFKTRGGALLNDAEMLKAEKVKDGWVVHTRAGEIKAKVIINCAGAWGDVVAERAGVKPLGLKPLRRTIVMAPADIIDPRGPIVIDIDEDYYFKPEGRQYLISPADETLTAASDAQPEIEDIAIAVDKFERITKTSVAKVENAWAGLRTFAPDRAPVIGFDDNNEGFFWSVGQGGYGIQTAPAWSEAAANIILTGDLPEKLKLLGANEKTYSPNRLCA